MNRPTCLKLPVSGLAQTAIAFQTSNQLNLLPTGSLGLTRPPVQRASFIWIRLLKDSRSCGVYVAPASTQTHSVKHEPGVTGRSERTDAP